MEYSKKWSIYCCIRLPGCKGQEKKEKRDEGPSSKRDEDERKMGKIVWNLNIKKKIQNFIWKVYHDRIVVRSYLKK